MSYQRWTSQSLPRDYAILSHFGDDARHDQDDNTELPHPCGIPIRRVASMADISERTPLIKHNPPIPHIQEATDESVSEQSDSEQIRSTQMFREELGTLMRYSLPVFAYATGAYSIIYLIVY